MQVLVFVTCYADNDMVQPLTVDNMIKPPMDGDMIKPPMDGDMMETMTDGGIGGVTTHRLLTIITDGNHPYRFNPFDI